METLGDLHWRHIRGSGAPVWAETAVQRVGETGIDQAAMLRKIQDQKPNASDKAEPQAEPPSDATTEPQCDAVQVSRPSARLGEILLEAKVITKAQLDEGLARRKELGGFLGRRLVELGYLDQDKLTMVLVKQCKIPHLNLRDYSISDEVLELIPRELCQRFQILPVDKLGMILTVAMVDPLNDQALDAVREACPNLRIKPILCQWNQFEEVFDRLISGNSAEDSQTKTADDALFEQVVGKKKNVSKPKPQPSAPPEAAPEPITHAIEVDEPTPSGDVAPELEMPMATGATTPAASAIDIEALQAAIQAGMQDTVAALETKLSEATALLAEAKKVEEEHVRAQIESDLAAPAAKTPEASYVVALGPGSDSEESALFTFENFIVGEANQGAMRIALDVAGSPGGEANPLFVCGDVGLGKTHLIHAIGNRIADDRPGISVGYTSAKRFAEHALIASEQGRVDVFRHAYEGWDVLVLDDIQFLGGHVDAQEVFFEIFGMFQMAEKQIVMAGDRAPEKLGMLEKRLVSRFDSGVVTFLTVPEWDTRVEILRHHANRREIQAPDDVIAMIAMNYSSDVRRMIGALRKVAVAARASGKELNASVASEVLASMGSESAA
jgi:chromosomal replication initiator protein DnaA